MKQSFRTRLRQLWIPLEFRLPEPEFTAEQLDILEELIQLMSPNFSRAEETAKDERLEMARFLIELSTGIWRVRRKIEGLSRMPKEIKDALYSLESTWMSMSEGGVEIIDHIGVMPSKHEAKIIEIRETPGLAREQVIDTIKPTILIRGEVVQQGEVIVGRPASPRYAAETTQPAGRPDEKIEDEKIETGNEEPSPLPEPENQSLNSPDQIDVGDASGAPVATGPEADERADAENPAGGETALADAAAEQSAAGENDAEQKIETASDDDESVIEIPLPQKRTRRKNVLSASIKTKLAAVPEIGEKSAKKEESTAPKRGRKRAAAARKNGQSETGGNSETDSAVTKEEA
ncbi:MAG: hypothetical protein LBS53_00760 [Synergistaceae bacterium]|nr:hypothetical protein [Synergistaceae bacterium]